MSTTGSGAWVVTDAQAGERVDRVLASAVPALSRSRWQKLLAAGHVTRDGEPLAQGDLVNAADELVYTIPPPEPLDLDPADIPLAVLYEDDDVIAVDKAPGMVVHPGAGQTRGTLVHALLHHCRGQLSGIGGVERPGIVHRLDRETSGVIIMAKHDEAHQVLARAFAERTTEKTYRAWVRGVPAHREGEIDAPIGRHRVHRKKMCVRDDGRPARSRFAVEERAGPAAALLRVQIFTGRTHQIRVHCAHLGHPVLGDATYGQKTLAKFTGAIPRVMLHAARLVVPHPRTGEPLVLKAPLPDDFQALGSALREQFGGDPVA